MLSLDQFIQSVNRSHLKLDLSGVVGLLGGNNAADALKMIHLYAGQRWAGWHNYPGSVTVAKRFGQIAKSRLWDSVFPGPNRSPAIAFGLDGKPGPRYSASLSGTRLPETRYLGYLVEQECANLPEKELQLTKRDGSAGRKTWNCATISVISIPPRKGNPTSSNSVEIAKREHELPIAPKCDPPLARLAVIPSLLSVLACVFCAVGRDFLCASVILLGIINSGVSSIILGTATLKICAPVPSSSSPPGDGLLFPADGSIIILKGQEIDVNVITRGGFELEYPEWISRRQSYHTIGVSSLLLIMQSLAQLLLIPFSTLFGQILYLLTFVASGLYHLYVVSQDVEEVQRELLLRQLSTRTDKLRLGNRTQMSVFVCLALAEDIDRQSYDPEEALKAIIPNETSVWRYWRRSAEGICTFLEAGARVTVLRTGHQARARGRNRI